MDSLTHKFPAQQLPFNQKGKKWRKQCVDFACDHTFLVSGANRKSTLHKQLNYDLIQGIVHMDDIELVLNPTHIKDDLIPEKIQHYPIINSKLNILRGEESKRVFDSKVVVTDYNSITEASNAKKAELFQELQQLIEDTSISEEQMQERVEDLDKYYSYTWQDAKELRGNIVLTQYDREYHFDMLFNEGIVDGMTVGEEMYMCDIIGGEPTLEKLNPKKVTVVRNSYSRNIEDADMIIIEDYWSPGKIVDVYHEVLTPKDRKYIEELNSDSLTGTDTDEMGNLHEKNGFVYVGDIKLTDKEVINALFTDRKEFTASAPYDFDGNIRVIRVFWKSRRKILKVTSYDPETGEEVINFYPETYVPNKDMGEKVEEFWINEAWEGTKIGENVYVNIRPRPVQYNRMSNPSRCHFGIIGSLYTINDEVPYSMVDMMKPYNYLYDVTHDRLNRLIAKNYGKIMKLDLALVPDDWKIDKWLYFARKDKVAVTDSFKEGNKGQATGKLAGALNNNSNGVIDLDEGNTIQQYINILEFCKLEMAEVVGISKQREGQISNRETVGGVERATLQSSHITEWVFTIHEDIKRRVLNCFLETAKIAMKGRNKKFQYILPDFAQRIVDIDGDEFAEADYGVMVDSSNELQELKQKMEGLVTAAMNSQMVNFSTALKMFTACSLSEKLRMLEQQEKQSMQMQQQARQEELQAKQQEVEAKALLEQQKMELDNAMNERDNDTKLTIAMLQQQANQQEEMPETTDSKDALLEKMREFDLKLQLDRDRLAFDKDKADKDRQVKKQQIHSRPSTK